MLAIDVNKKLVNSYLKLLENLSRSDKLDLISGLSDSMKPGKEKKGSLKSLTGDFIPEKSADEIIDDLKQSRYFKRNTDSF